MPPRLRRLPVPPFLGDQESALGTVPPLRIHKPDFDAMPSSRSHRDRHGAGYWSLPGSGVVPIAFDVRGNLVRAGTLDGQGARSVDVGCGATTECRAAGTVPRDAVDG